MKKHSKKQKPSSEAKRKDNVDGPSVSEAGTAKTKSQSHRSEKDIHRDISALKTFLPKLYAARGIQLNFSGERLERYVRELKANGAIGVLVITLINAWVIKDKSGASVSNYPHCQHSEDFNYFLDHLKQIIEETQAEIPFDESDLSFMPKELQVEMGILLQGLPNLEDHEDDRPIAIDDTATAKRTHAVNASGVNQPHILQITNLSSELERVESSLMPVNSQSAGIAPQLESNLPSDASRTKVSAETLSNDIKEWIGRISSRVSDCAKAFVDVGQELINARLALGYGQWETMLKSGKLPISLRSAQIFMKIARNSGLVETKHISFLPPVQNALYVLSHLAPEQINEGIKEGKIHQEMSAKEAKSYVDSVLSSGKLDNRTASPDIDGCLRMFRACVERIATKVPADCLPTLEREMIEMIPSLIKEPLNERSKSSKTV